MACYSDVPRQYGGGLGGIFKILALTIFPTIIKSARPLLKSQAKKVLPSLAKAGLGLVDDIQNKRNFKTAIKARGKQLASDVFSGVLNDRSPPPKRHKPSRRETVKTFPKQRSKTKKPKNIPRDVFSTIQILIK